jgi:hypothetical protein
MQPSDGQNCDFMQSFEALLSTAGRLAQLPPPERARWEAELTEFVGQDASRLPAALHALRLMATPDLAAQSDQLLARVLARLPPSARSARSTLDEQAIDDLAHFYKRLPNTDRARQQILRLLAADGGQRALRTFADLLATDPPQGSEEAGLAFVPLFRSQNIAADALFPRLLACLEHPALAGIVLDLANYLFRKGLVSRHPAAGRVHQLADLMQNLVRRLGRIEEHPREYAASPQQLNRIVGECVALVVSLCDALALAGDPEVTPKLYQALELSHRRVRTEAAAALVRLGDEAGLDTLVAMTAEPVVRSRALRYLEELDMLDRVPANRSSAAARAEGALAAWLAEPTHVGVPPGSLELVDARQQFWPGFESAVGCYLFRFEYRIGEKLLAGIGIAGPVTHAFMCDMQDFSPDDIYAAYAGWFAEHADIQQTSADALSAADQAAWQAPRAQLEAAGYREIELVLRGVFFGRVQWAAAAQRHGRPGAVVSDDGRICWYPQPPARHPPGVAEMYYVHKGRELLRAFNSE